MDELISRISEVSGLEPEKTREALVAILEFLRREGPPAEVDQLFAAIPGADAAARPVEPASDSASAGGMFGGGGLMALAGQLTSLGLGMGDMQAIGRELFAYARERAGEDAIGQIAGAIPGLSQFI